VAAGAAGAVEARPVLQPADGDDVDAIPAAPGRRSRAWTPSRRPPGPGVGKAGRGLDRGAVRRREGNLLTGYAIS
jgi:hypothetical protein